VLPLLFSNSSVTPELCIDYANSMYAKSPSPTTRMPYLFVEYHDECYGGSLLAFTGSAVTTLVGTKACTDACAGSSKTTYTTNGKTVVATNTANMCGGPKQFNLYALSTDVAMPTSSGPVVTMTA
jgi:iron transport multicopper oxidase